MTKNSIEDSTYLPNKMFFSEDDLQYSSVKIWTNGSRVELRQGTKSVILLVNTGSKRLLLGAQNMCGLAGQMV